MSVPTTIFAPATAQGRAGIAIFRISGPAAQTVFAKLCRSHALPQPRQAELRTLYDPATSEPIDHALILWFPAPHSFTGEDVVELHVHGGRAVNAALMNSLSRLAHFRLAEPGEFTRRAFENGKMDMTEAEAIADLVHAETEAQRRQALRQLDGALGTLYDSWRDTLMRILAYHEAAIDFADEDLPKDIAEKQTDALQTLIADITRHSDDGHRGERLREGFSVAILGPPNAGKSSLLNALSRRDAAIVSSTAGTTRDVIEVHLDLNGYPVMLADTAGLRDSADAIENEGIRRARMRAAEADVKLLVFDGSHWPEMDKTTAALIDDKAIVVVNKADVVKEETKTAAANRQPLFLSAKTGEGIAELLQRITDYIVAQFPASSSAPLTRARHRAALEDCLQSLRRAQTATQTELRAEDIRLAARALGRITGRVDVEDMLDIVFRDFCIGK
jgi:tRNA modification GTPase